MHKPAGTRSAIVALHGLRDLETVAGMFTQLARSADHQKQIGMIMLDQHHRRHCRIHFADAAAGDGDIAAAGLDLTDHETVQRFAIRAFAGEQRSCFCVDAGNDANGLEHAAPSNNLPKGRHLAQH